MAILQYIQLWMGDFDTSSHDKQYKEAPLL